MNLEMAGQHVLITGGSKGIGLACARAFLIEEARVTIVSRSQANLDAALLELREHAAPNTVQALAADLIDAKSAHDMVERAVTAFGPIDVLVNSAGAAKRTPADELSPQAWRDAMDAKYFSYVNVFDPVIKQMGARGKGAIVNVIGAGGKVASTIHLAGGSANAALMLATAGLASAYGSRGVRVNGVNPGATLTERLIEGLRTEARNGGITESEARARSDSRTALKRLATPEEVADVVLFLASPRASYVTGVNLSMDGGGTAIVV